MTATLEQIRAAIGQRLTAIAEIGVVHPYERYAKTEKDFAGLYLWQSGGVTSLRGWFIRRVATRSFYKSQVWNRIETDWQIRGYLALQDAEASEIRMDSLVEQIRHALAADLTFGGLVEAAPPAEGQVFGPQLTESGPYMLGGVLCHGVALSLTTTHYETAEVAVGDDFKTFHANWDIPLHGNVGPDLPDDAHADATDHITLEIL